MRFNALSASTAFLDAIFVNSRSGSIPALRRGSGVTFGGCIGRGSLSGGATCCWAWMLIAGTLNERTEQSTNHSPREIMHRAYCGGPRERSWYVPIAETGPISRGAAVTPDSAIDETSQTTATRCCLHFETAS